MKPFTWLLNGPHLKFFTELSPEQFSKTFLESVERPDFFLGNYTPSTKLLGKITGAKFKLQERWFFINSGRPFFHGMVKPFNSGSEISGYFSINLIFKLFMILFLFWAILFSIIFIMVSGNALIEGAPMASIGFLTSLLAFILLVLATIYMKVINERKEEMYIIFFKEKFQALITERKE